MKRIVFIPITCFLLVTGLYSYTSVMLEGLKAKEYLFNEAWIWEYKNSEGQQGEFWVYRDAKREALLLTREDSYKGTDEMSRWFLIKANGQVIQAYNEAEMNTPLKCQSYQLTAKNTKKLPGYWKATKERKLFAETEHSVRSLKGKQYRLQYEATTESTTAFFYSEKTPFGWLAYFNDLEIEAKLPVRFPQDLPLRYVVLGEETSGAGFHSTYFLREISQTEYVITIP